VNPTTTDAVHALLYLEETRNNPLATLDLNQPDILNNEELKNKVQVAKKSVDEIVAQRFEYIKCNYIDKNKPIIDAKEIEDNA
jgi:hypothetical protein